jgi:hypothetical protein
VEYFRTSLIVITWIQHPLRKYEKQKKMILTSSITYIFFFWKWNKIPVVHNLRYLLSSCEFIWRTRVGSGRKEKGGPALQWHDPSESELCSQRKDIEGRWNSSPPSSRFIFICFIREYSLPSLLLHNRFKVPSGWSLIIIILSTQN